MAIIYEPYNDNVRFSYQTYPFDCPYTIESDNNNNFQGCTVASVVNNDPYCIRSDPLTGACTACIFGYEPSASGVCSLQLVDCGDRKYNSFGSCIDVDPSCDGYDKFTGFCTSCKQ